MAAPMTSCVSASRYVPCVFSVDFISLFSVDCHRVDRGICLNHRVAGMDKNVSHRMQPGGLYDPANMPLLHHVQQALRAHVHYKLDVQYMIKDGGVVIVDEFTGRLMPGRRWSDGLHQAV